MGTFKTYKKCILRKSRNPQKENGNNTAGHPVYLHRKKTIKYPHYLFVLNKYKLFFYKTKSAYLWPLLLILVSLAVIYNKHLWLDVTY